MVDETDLRILRVLQDNGRITNKDLAETCNLSPSACLERVRRLESNGVINGYAALLSHSKLNRKLLLFIQVQVDRTDEAVFSAFAARALKAADILECHLVAGGFDYLLKARVADMEAYRTLLGDTILRMPGVREVRTYPVLEEVKNTTSISI